MQTGDSYSIINEKEKSNYGKKIFCIFIILILIFIFSSTIVQAISVSNIVGGADNFVNSGKDGNTSTLDGPMLNNTSNFIYNTLLIIGVCIAVLIGTVLGIQFITGSVEQKVKVKESLIPFVVGCVVIFSAFGIWKLVIEILR